MSWYHNAVFYQALVGSFKADGDKEVGTLRGIIDKLDYLQWLGVDCLWLSPFYASPLRDDGYDIADYYSIHPDYGTMEDFEELIAELHRRGMRIMTDLALNHTSSDHPWFQASRTDPPAPMAISMSGAMTRSATPKSVSFSPTWKHPIGPGMTSAASTTSTASTPTSRI